MLGFVQHILAPPAHPIGIDLGTDSLRLAQVRMDDEDFKLIAAASAEIPAQVRDDPKARLEFFTQTVIQLIRQAPFRGRRVVLGLPGPVVHIQQILLPKMEEKELKNAVVEATKRKLPFEASKAMLRHVVVGTAGQNGQASQRVIAMAADSRWVNSFLAAADKARLDVVAVNVQPLALIDCFVNVYRRTSEMESTRFYIDIGSSGTRAIIARGAKLLYARSLQIGGDHLTRSVADSMGMSFQDAKTLRLKQGAGAVKDTAVLDAACQYSLDDLIHELEICRQEHETAFPDLPVDLLMFVGGEARQPGIRERIAKRMNLPEQIGDSLCRMVRNSRIGIESAIDRRLPQPAWATAVGLSMGPRPVED